ncbi:MAG: sigma-70 family RNA polymerase sigma factor [Planctomycetia bacterium]|nr:sigma-70 family RNA polymerase sigma factor [Planctomycetia bacterium]
MSDSTNKTAEDASSLDQVPSAEFVQLFTKLQRRLFLFILSQVGSPVDAEEVLQETNVIIWSKFHQFQLGTNFFAWAGMIATYEIRKFRDRRRDRRLQFSDEFLSQVSEDAIEISEELELRREALNECLHRLKPEDRELIQARYAPGENGLRVAEKLGRPSNSVYQSVGRIRKVLFDCVTRRLASAARATT